MIEKTEDDLFDSFFLDFSSELDLDAVLSMAQRVQTDIIGVIEEYLWIRTKESTVVRLTLNKAQRVFGKWVQKCLDSGTPMRAIILKARQLGFSTLIEAIIFVITITHENIESHIISHSKDSTSNLFAMSELFYDRLDEKIKPMKSRRNRNELIFQNPKEDERSYNPGLLSKIVVDTANNERAGRSTTIHFLHGSEVAFWSDPTTLLAGMRESMPENNPLTMVVLESTANGYGNYFQVEWDLAEKGRSIYTPFFFPWFQEDSYRTPLSEMEKNTWKLDAEEVRISTKWKLDPEQLKWRRDKIMGMEALARSEKDPAKIGLSGLQLFWQEYPCEPREAFLSTGRPVFDVEALKWYQDNRVRKPEFVGYLDDARDGRIVPVEDPQGYLQIWELPAKGEGYIIGGDIAEGLGTGDYTSFDVISQTTGAQVAHWWGHIDPDLATDEMEKLGIFYNQALLAPESNNHGLLVCIGLQHRNYPRLYMRQTMGNRSDKEKEQIGWQTNKATKPVMIGELAADIRDHLVDLPCAETIEELFTYIRDEKGAFGAQPGAHDDRVVSLAIALMVRTNAPLMRGRRIRSRIQSKQRRPALTSRASSFTGY